MSYEDLAPILKDFGGWAAVLLIVRWMMSRMDRLIDSMQVSISTFQKFQENEEKTHADLIETQREILEQVKELRLIRNLNTQ